MRNGIGLRRLTLTVVQRGAKLVRVSSSDHRERIPEVERPGLISDVTEHAHAFAIPDLVEDLAAKLEIVALLIDRERSITFDENAVVRCSNEVFLVTSAVFGIKLTFGIRAKGMDAQSCPYEQPRLS